MTLDNFIKKYNATQLDFDGAYGFQCVDVFRQYCKDVLFIKHTGSVKGAKDLYINYDNLPDEKLFFDRVEINNISDLRKGDVVVFDRTDKNAFGHVAIVYSIVNYLFYTFEQNGITQSGCEIKVRKNLFNVLGVLRYKGGLV